MVFEFVQSITLWTLSLICVTYKYSIFPLLAILVLGNTGIHVSTANYSYIASNIKTIID